MEKIEILLHSCCAPCSAYPLEFLKKLDYRVTGFFSNSNIYPQDEYAKRLEAYKKLFNISGLDFTEDEYNPSEWSGSVGKGCEEEPERGKRCAMCIYARLKRAAAFAAGRGIEYFTTTLTISPYKDLKMIFDAGVEAGRVSGVRFLKLDFGKKEGFNRSQKLAREHGFYIQNYCGCYFSMNPKMSTKKEVPVISGDKI
jgi:epoxyqueuosine reductase